MVRHPSEHMYNFYLCGYKLCRCIINQKQFKFIKTDILYTKQGNKQWEKYQHSNSRGSTTLFLINITEEYITLPELRARNQGCPLCALVSHG